MMLFQGQNAGSVGFAGAQRALMGRIGEGLEASKEAKNQLNYKANLPVLGNDPVSSIKSFLSNITRKIK